jgi:putative PIN family toxin of toxin-antitoxin system
MRVVIDTNVLVSAVLGGQLAEVISRWQVGDFTLVVSDVIAAEYLAVLRRPKFGLPAQVIDAIGAYVFQRAEFVTPQALRVVTADPKDDKFIEAAVTGRADVIVSGDKHLLSLGAYHAIPIITARTFLGQLASAQGSSPSSA